MRKAALLLVVCFGFAGAAWAQPNVFYERYQAGREQLDKAQLGEAVTTLTAALAAVPADQVPDLNIYVALGYAQMRLGRLDDAESNFTIAQREVSRLTPTSRQQLDANWQVLRALRKH